jgi:hypothetical protein
MKGYVHVYKTCREMTLDRISVKVFPFPLTTADPVFLNELLLFVLTSRISNTLAMLPQE